MVSKRRALVALAASLMLIMGACGGGDDEGLVCKGDGDIATTGVGMSYDIGGRGDQSFNDLAAAALDNACDNEGITAQELEPASGGENREENLRLLADEGYGLLIPVGFAYQDIVYGIADNPDTEEDESKTGVAADYPDQLFGIVDGGSNDIPNVVGMTFAEHEGSFLVGAAAALKSESGVIGFIGGVNVPLIQKFQAGFEAGVHYINPDAEVLVQYLSEPPDFSGFGDPAKGKEAALGMYQQDADVVYHAAGGSGGGLFEAAKEISDSSGSKVWAIGVDSDQINVVSEDLQPYILTSMLKKVDVAVGQTITSYLAGEDIGGQTFVFDLSVGGVDYSTSGGNLDDIKDQLDSIKQDIIDGTITVPDSV
jgi:basic membrane protein A